MKQGQNVRCPKCGAEVGNACRSLTQGRTTDTHAARFEIAAKSYLPGWDD